MPNYTATPYAQPVAQKHTGTLLSLIFGTIIGVIGLPVVGLFTYIVYVLTPTSYREGQGVNVLAYGTGALLLLVAIAMVAMWVLFFMRRYKAALYTSFVPMVFVVLAFGGWQILGFVARSAR